jgi:hypothetical protein
MGGRTEARAVQPRHGDRQTAHPGRGPASGPAGHVGRRQTDRRAVGARVTRPGGTIAGGRGGTVAPPEPMTAALERSPARRRFASAASGESAGARQRRERRSRRSARLSSRRLKLSSALDDASPARNQTTRACSVPIAVGVSGRIVDRLCVTWTRSVFSTVRVTPNASRKNHRSSAGGASSRALAGADLAVNATGSAGSRSHVRRGFGSLRSAATPRTRRASGYADPSTRRLTS